MFRFSRKHLRNLHVIAAAYNFAYVYTPLHDWQHGLLMVQWVSFPALLATGCMFGKNYFINWRNKRLASIST